MAARAKNRILAQRFAHAISVHYRNLTTLTYTEFDYVALLAMLQIYLVNRTITRLLEGILFICGPSSIICARAERGCK